MIYRTEDELLLKKALLMYQEKALASLPKADELEEITFTEVFENKMNKLINFQKKPYYFIINTIGKRVACIIFAFLISFTAMLFVDAIREPFINYVVETYEKYSEIIFRGTSRITPETFVNYCPQYIPEGYEKVYRDGSSEYMYNEISFMNESGDNIEFTQNITGGSTGINTEGVETEKVYVNNLEAIYWENLGEICILFADNNYEFFVSGKANEICKEELIKIAESIEPEEK